MSKYSFQTRNFVLCSPCFTGTDAHLLQILTSCYNYNHHWHHIFHVIWKHRWSGMMKEISRVADALKIHTDKLMPKKFSFQILNVGIW